MNAIEEAMLRAWYEYRYDEIGDEDDWKYEQVKPSENFEEGFLAGIRYLMSLPLCDRLKSEEREKIKSIYEEELGFAQFYQKKANSCVNNACKIDYETNRDIAKSRASMLEKVFGTAMFEEK